MVPNLNSHKNRKLGAGNQRVVAFACKILVVSGLCLTTGVLVAAPSDRCEIVFTDSQAAVLRADALTGGPALITRDRKLMQPFGIAIGQNGEFFISDTGCLGILGINPLTGEQRMISCGGILGLPFGIAVERSGMILVANAEALLRVNPETGAQTIVSSHGLFRAPLAVGQSTLTCLHGRTLGGRRNL